MDKRFRIQRRPHTRPRYMPTRPSLSTSGLAEFITTWSSSSSSNGPVRYHVKVSPQCSICAGTIFVDEKAIALFGNNNGYKGQTPPFPLPSLGTGSRSPNGNLFCRMKNCSCEESSIEYTTVHSACYQIFLTVCDFGKLQQDYALQKLWISTTWRLPWKTAFSMPASNMYIPTSPKSLELSGQLFGVTFLHRLPQELVLAIWRESKDALFWRCMSIIRMVTEFETNTAELQIKPLDQVVSWRRNGNLECAPASAMYPVTKLTIDQEGIREVERLRRRPQYTGEFHSDSTFIVEEGSSLHGIEAQFQDGRLRLQTTRIQPKYPFVWNTPAPPRFSLCNAHIYYLFKTWRLRVVNTQKIVGITFFFLQDRVYDIYIHDSDESSANALYEQLSPEMQRGAFWIYLPIGTTDRMLVLGTRVVSRGEYNILVRMEKAGDVVIGRNNFFSEVDYPYEDPPPEDWPSARPDQCLGGDGPVTLVYGDRAQGYLDIPLFGAYCESSSWTLPEPFMLEKPTPGRFDRFGYYSRTPLGQIAESTVYYRSDTGGCRGILLRYKNGGCRAVGQCRVNVDPSETTAEPSLICVRNEDYRNSQGRTLGKTQVKFTHDTLDDKVDEGWARHPLEGFIEFYFFYDRVLVEITTEFHEDVVREIERPKKSLFWLDMAYKHGIKDEDEENAPRGGGEDEPDLA